MSAFKDPTYSPGGMTSPARRRHQAREAGFASGRARRARSTCKRQPRVRSGQHALALAYKQPGISRRDFDVAYEREHPFPDGAPDVAGWQWLRGRETAWKIVQALERWWRSQGQHFAFTNAQLLATAARLGLALSIRQLQRVRGLLAAFGYGVAAHVRRGGAAAGNKDYLRFERRWTGRRRPVCMSVMPPTGAGASPFGAQLAPASPATTTALIAPPSAADGIGRRCAAPGSESRKAVSPDQPTPAAQPAYSSEHERRYAFIRLCQQHAPMLVTAGQRQELARLRALLEGSGQDTARTDSIACEGER